jgi:hypothetical protein
MMSFMFCTLYQTLLGYHTVEEEVAGCVARTVVKRSAYRVLVRKPEGKRPLEDIGIGGRAVFKWMIKRG